MPSGPFPCPFAALRLRDWAAGAIWALKQASREHTSTSRLQLRSTAKPDGSGDPLNTFKSTLGGTLGRFSLRGA